MFESIEQLQKYHLLCVLLVLIGHVLLLFLRGYKKNNEMIDDFGTYVIKGHKKSIYGELLKAFDIIVFIIFPYTFHLLYVSIMFLGSYIPIIDKELNWEACVRIYARSLVIVIFCILFHHYSLKIYGSYNLVFLLPASLSDCKYVSLQKKSNTSKQNEGLLFMTKRLLFESFDSVPSLHEVNICSKHIDFFGSNLSRYFEYNHEKYWWIDDKFTWSREYLMTKLSYRFDISAKLDEKNSLAIGALNVKDRKSIIEVVGLNTVELPQTSMLNLVISELRYAINIIRIITLLDSVFYSFIIWPLCWSIPTFYSIFWSVLKKRNYIETEKILQCHDDDLYKLLDEKCTQLPLNINEINSKSSFIYSKELFPGSIIFIDKSMRIPADLILLSGSIIVDESCLTGEAIPQNKTANASSFNFRELIEINRNFNDQRAIFAGSHVIEVSSSTPAFGIVVKTGSVTLNNIFNTNSLSIHPFINLDSPSENQICLPHNIFKGLSKTNKWNIKIKPLWIICLLFGLFITFFDAYVLSFEITSIFFILSTIIYILPFWATTSMSFSLNSFIKRLLKDNIISTNSCKLDQLKIVDTICFDKTGTLTIPEFNIYKIHIYPGIINSDGIPCDNNNNLGNSHLFQNANNTRFASLNDKKFVLNIAMATCNNLIFQNFENKSCTFEPSGSKLELSLFNSSGYFGCKIFTQNSERICVIPNNNKNEFLFELENLRNFLNKVNSPKSIECILAICDGIEVVKRYPFDENLRLQSVYVKKYFIDSKIDNTDSFLVKSISIILTKGAVENISKLTDNSRINENTILGNNNEEKYATNYANEKSDLEKNCSELGAKKDQQSGFGFTIWSSEILANQISGSYALGFCYIILNDDINISSEVKIQKDEEFLNNIDQKTLIDSYQFIQLGIVELFSPIRKESKETIQTLIKGNFHCKMITGDHINSAVLVSKEIGIINDHFVLCSVDDNYNLVWDFVSKGEKEIIDKNAILSSAFPYSILNLIPKSILYNNTSIAINICAFKILIEFLNVNNNSNIYTNCRSNSDTVKSAILCENHKVFVKLLENIKIFSRFTPEYKGKVVCLLESIGKTVFFVGDGQNDVVALQKANIGLLLSNCKDASDNQDYNCIHNETKSSNLLNENNHNVALSPFIAKITNEIGLYSIIKLIIESRGVVFTQVSKYNHVIYLGIFFISCKSILLWKSHAIIPAMSWLFIDIFCTFIPLLLFSFTIPNENKKTYSQNSYKNKFMGILSDKKNIYSNSENLHYSPLNRYENVYDSFNKKTKSSCGKHFFCPLYDQIYTIPVNYGNHLIYTSTLISIIISIFGYIVMLFRLTNYVLPKNGMSSSYEQNILIPTYLWYVKQDNFESASSWCYITFQLVNQFWSIWIRSSSIINMKMNIYLVIWNITVNLFVLFLIWTKPCILSCIFRINCDNETSLKRFTNLFDISSPFYGKYGHNLFPLEWKVELTFWCFLFFALNVLSIVIIKRINTSSS
ncbi:hypothetical protein FG379_002090 [Cryptosporidium bovis]|uniref:uncharacterized protein n=1 Tax=Cryptosporidium bovis TaxID=310047 RepID=UPI00351A0192|nr:hypothetical protein FG379_002090 [Cryptosporidium bovis]